jgi:NitT/TauT family transport system ATP-binding protein/sulfonate transport system ATP-binding protein
MYGTPITGPGPERGMVFQDYALFPWLTVRQNIGFGPRQNGLPKENLDQIAARYMNMVGLTQFADYYPSQLSGGMKQRVAIARVLANDCEVLLMDEPFGALDEFTRQRLDTELLGLWAQQRLTTIFVTHSIYEAVFLSTRVAVMGARPGRVIAEIAIDEPHPRSDAFRVSTKFAQTCQRLSSLVADAGAATRSQPIAER